MKIAIIGRGELLFETAKLFVNKGFKVPLVITAKEAPEYKVKAADFELFAHENNALFIQTPKINEHQVIAKIKELGVIDVAISINYSGVIAETVISLFKNGILNAHGGDLPRYRGNACQAWAIINGEKEIGLCIHQMIGGELDSGDIWEKKLYPITQDTRIGEVYEWFERDIPFMMLSAVFKIQNGEFHHLIKQSKDPKEALRCYPRLPEDGKINWNAPAEEIIRLINASSEPYSGAYCVYEGNILTIWRAKLEIDFENHLSVAGQVCKIDNNTKEVVVSCKTGKIRLLEVEYNGLRGLPTNIINSIRKRLK